MQQYKFFLRGILLPSGTWISQLQDTTPAPNAAWLTEYAAGGTMPSFQGAQGGAPDVSFTTTQVGDILTACGMVGADLSAGNVDLYYQAAANLGFRQAIGSSVHLRIRAPKSFLGWTRLSAAQDQPATIACRLVPLYDGTNQPLVGAGSVTIPALSLVTQQYTLGPVTLNGSTPGGIVSWDLDLAPSINLDKSDGEDFPSWMDVARHNPILTPTLRGLGDWATSGLSGVALTAAVFYLRKRQPDSVLVYPNATAAHIKFIAVDNPCGFAAVDNTSGGVGPAAAQNRLRCAFRISSAATAYPLTVTVGSAIT